MIQIRVHGPGDVRVDDVAEPSPGPRDAVVRVAACGICGTDVSYVRHGGVAGPGPEPMCLGHEVAGVVEQVGSEVTSVRVGDRVVVQPGNDALGRIGNGAPEGGLTPLLLVTDADQGRLHAVPAGLPLDLAALAEPLAVRPGDGVCVFGCGPIGLSAVASLVDRGHERVVAVDLNARRRELALELGAQAVLDPTTQDVWQELGALHGTTRFAGGDVPATAGFIEASGSSRVLGDVIDHAGPGANISVVALHFRPVPVDFVRVLTKELTIRGSIEYPARFSDAVDLLGRRDLSALITDRYPLESFPEAFARVEGAQNCGKVLVVVDGELV
jgi:threonine dehydrogenase-like Zn-dependent dehydrogenase